MKKNYYYFVSGLPEIAFDDQKPKIKLSDFKSNLKENTSHEDYTLIKLFFQRYDHINLLNILQKKEEQFIELGNYSRHELEEQIKQIREEGLGKKDNILPSYLELFIFNYYNESPEFPNLSLENQISTVYFEHTRNCGNSFIADFFDFELNRLNILTALNCRNHKLDPENEVLGNTEFSNIIRTSNAKDFGIGNDLDYVNKLIQIQEISDLYERERKIDQLRWNYLDNAVFFYYFSIEKIFTYLIKLDILDRWASLDEDNGEKEFKNMLTELESSYEFPSEYKIK